MLDNLFSFDITVRLLSHDFVQQALLAAALLGLPDAVDRLAPANWVGRTDQVDRVAVLLIDGMGWHLLPELAKDAPLLASVLAGDLGRQARLQQLDCTFPSTTPSSLVSLGTGAPPGEHGILGFTLNIPGTDRVINHILWRDDPPHALWQPLPTWFERLNHAGISTRAVLPAMFMGSGLTDAAYRGARFCPTHPAEDYAQRLSDELHAAPGLVYGYAADLDTAAHVFGIGSSQWHEAAARVDALLTRGAAGDRRPRRPQRPGERAHRLRHRPTPRGRSTGGRRRAAGAVPAHRAGRNRRCAGHLA